MITERLFCVKAFGAAKWGYSQVRPRIQKYIRMGSPSMIAIMAVNTC